MEMCWRSAAAASARGARQWRCAGEEQLRQAQGALANGDVLAKTSGGQRKGRSPMEMCWRGAAVASARGVRPWRCAGKEQVRQVQGALANGDVLAKRTCGKLHIFALVYILFMWSRYMSIYIYFCSLFYTCLGLLSIFFMHVSDIYVYVLIRLLNSLGRFGACRGCVECLQYIYIYISSASTQPTSPFGCVFVCTRVHNRDTYLSIHISALFYILFA